jgi:threonine/homoserine/homoserine lactone efflux protein
MRWELFLAFLSAALIVQVVPGPGMLFILAQGIAGGPRAGVAAACGAATGMVFHTFAAALGLAALFAHAPSAYDALRVGGAVYLLWLAIGHFRSATGGLAESAHEPMSVRRVFVRAWLNNLANPKVILFYLAFLPQFVAPRAGSPTLQLLMLGFVFLLLGLVIDLALGFFSGHIGAWLRRRPTFRKGIDRLAGTIMGALGVRLLISGRHS